MPARLSFDRDKLTDFCRRHHIARLAFFGSVLRTDFRPDSDVDVLYEFEEGHVPGWEIVNIEQELAEILGRRVDFVPFKFLNRWIRNQILAEAEVQYAR